jgi:hypothetical protein
MATAGDRLDAVTVCDRSAERGIEFRRGKLPVA